MKTISTLLTSLFLTSSIFATDFRSTASLTIKSANKADIVVIVDDKRFDLGSNSIMISDLDACEHDVTVYQERNNSPVSFFEKRYDVIFKSEVELKPRTNLQIGISDCGDITMNETKFKPRKLGDDWNGENYFEPNSVVNGEIYSKAISNTDFSRVLWAISKESFESNRMRSANQIICTNYLTVEQIKRLLQLFDSEDNKLELAKLAYDKTVDQSNYYSLESLFRFNEDKDELARCIHSH